MSSWRNRDLRVEAPEGTSYWSGQDEHGQRIDIIIRDPARCMKHTTTEETTPSLTFMPRAMEIDSYDDEELWRTASVEETCLDPPPPLPTKKELKRQKKERMAKRGVRRAKRFGRIGPVDNDKELGIDPDRESGPVPTPTPIPAPIPIPIPIPAPAPAPAPAQTPSSTSPATMSTTKSTREICGQSSRIRSRTLATATLPAKMPCPRTHELLGRLLRAVPTEHLLRDDGAVVPVIPSMLSRLVLDSSWQLLAEMRLQLDPLDNDLTATLYEQLVESIGNSTRPEPRVDAVRAPGRTCGTEAADL